MKKIGIISDTHGYMDARIKAHLSPCDEIWHGGDIGSINIESDVFENKVIRAVHGNIDDAHTRQLYPEQLIFEVEGVKIGMLHIGGRPGRPSAAMRLMVAHHSLHMVITGHSHIPVVVQDRDLGVLFVNPGACGHEGFHTMRTMMTCEIDQGQIKNFSIIELGKRGKALQLSQIPH